MRHSAWPWRCLCANPPRRRRHKRGRHRRHLGLSSLLGERNLHPRLADLPYAGPVQAAAIFYPYRHTFGRHFHTVSAIASAHSQPVPVRPFVDPVGFNSNGYRSISCFCPNEKGRRQSGQTCRAISGRHFLMLNCMVHLEQVYVFTVIVSSFLASVIGEHLAIDSPRPGSAPNVRTRSGMRTPAVPERRRAGSPAE